MEGNSKRKPKKQEAFQASHPPYVDTVQTLDIRLKAEIDVLAAGAKTLALRACYFYLRGSLRGTREEYKQRRKRMVRIEEGIQTINTDLEGIATRIEMLVGAIREVQTPPDSYLPILCLAGLAGPEEYFRSNKMPDPGAPLGQSLKLITAAKACLSDLLSSLKDPVLEIRPQWKVKPWIMFQRGALDYLLEQIYRTAGLS